MRGTVLSVSVLSVGLGVLLALTDVVTVNVGDPNIVHLVELALIMTLFADGLIVESELLRMHWGPPARAIVFAMPITLGILAVFGDRPLPGSERGRGVPARRGAHADRSGRDLVGGDLATGA